MVNYVVPLLPEYFLRLARIKLLLLTILPVTFELETLLDGTPVIVVCNHPLAVLPFTSLRLSCFSFLTELKPLATL